MNKMQFAGRWVVITGASSGLGEEMAHQLAHGHQANLVLVARRTDKLELLKHTLERDAGVQCRVITADLSRPEDVERVFRESLQAGEIYAAILNAGITHFGRHEDLSWSGFQQLLATNVGSVVRLVNLYSEHILQRDNGGGLLLVSSVASLVPVPYQAAYAGSKAFITHFAQSLWHELSDRNMSLTVFAPGGIDTPMTRDSNLKYFANTPFLQNVEDCAEEAIAALQSRRALHIAGWLNRLQLFLTRFLPRALLGKITKTAYAKALEAA